MNKQLKHQPSLEPADAITAVVLAGGRGSRMGGLDKGLQAFRGQSLVQHALARLAAQRGQAPAAYLVNANRNAGAYAAMGMTVVPDSMADYQGPLAGFLAALQQCRTPYLLTVPCDSPLFPLDLCERMLAALHNSPAQLAVAWAPEGVGRGGSAMLRSQPVFCLMRTEVQDSLRQYLHYGGRKIDSWTAAQGAVMVAFDRKGDDPLAFANANTLEELRRLERC